MTMKTIKAPFKFTLTAGGTLEIVFQDNRRYSPISCIPLFPLSDPDNYIALVHHTSDGKRNQIATIDHLKQLEPSQQLLVKKDIRFRYFTPEILEIYSIKSHRRTDNWLVRTDRGEVSFTVRNRQENMLPTANNSILITDENKSRFKITDRQKLNRGSQKELNRLI